MRTNKNCPKYGEEPETQVETTDLEKSSGKSNSLDPSSKSQQKLLKKKTMPKNATKNEAPEGEKSNLKAKGLPVKFTCGSTEKVSDKPTDRVAQCSDQPTTSNVQPVRSDIESGSRSVAKINKIIISNKAKPEDVQVESHKPTIVIRPPMDTDRGQVESHKPSIIIRPPTNTDRDHVESYKPSIVIRPPAEKDREWAHRKIVIKRPKEIIDLDQVSQDGSTGFEHRKTKKIVELSGFEKHGKQETMHFTSESAKRKVREVRRCWEEEEKRRNGKRLREERKYKEDVRVVEERKGLAELKRFEETIKWERAYDERQKAKKKKKMPEISDNYLEDYRARRNDRRIPERDRGTKRRPVVELGRSGAENAPATKRRRGGEVVTLLLLTCLMYHMVCPAHMLPVLPPFTVRYLS